MTDPSGESAFQTKTTIQSLLDAGGTHPKKRFGQCFLIDRNLMDKLLESAEIGPNDCSLEIGCGTGSLTGLLAARAGHVVAVDVDPDVLAIARAQTSESGNVTFVAGDALKRKSELAPEVESAVLSAKAAVSGDLKLVANLPYDIATPLVVVLLLSDLPFTRLCFTVQAEVADRFLAGPGTDDYGPVSILTQLAAEPHRVCKLPPQAFWPAPKVNSTMLRLDVRPRAERALADLRRFAEFIHGYFMFRRKTLGNIAKRLDHDERLLPYLQAAGLSAQDRPENLSPRQWVEAFRACQ